MIPKYRVWIPAIEQMHGVACIDFDGRTIRRGVPSLIVDDELGSCFELSECVLEQFTGLKDKNCVEIYEGDIVKGQSYLYGYELTNGKQFDYCGVVELHTLGYVGMEYVVTEQETFSTSLSKCCHRVAVDRLTGVVIGNIHQNPELLQEG